MLIGLFVQIFFGTPMLINFMYSSDPTRLLWFFSNALKFVPSYQFCNAFVNILAVSANQFDSSSALWVKGSPYEWDAFFKPLEGNISGGAFKRPSPFQSCMYSFMLGGLYLLLLWVFDHIVASNRGFSSNPFSFMFDWIFRIQKRRQRNRRLEEERILRAANFDEEGEEQEVIEDETAGIFLENVWKSYKLRCNRRGKKNDWALKDVSITIKSGELFGLLGPNGAGKTTMIG